MNFKKLKEERWFRILSNRYLLIIFIFGIWMLFFDSNSWLVHRELNEEIDQLESNQNYYEGEIESDRSVIDQLSDPDGLERFAREKYFMKRKNEDIFIIEYEDSIEER